MIELQLRSTAPYPRQPLPGPGGGRPSGAWPLRCTGHAEVRRWRQGSDPTLTGGKRAAVAHLATTP